jgi:hypothetical protein
MYGSYLGVNSLSNDNLKLLVGADEISNLTYGYEIVKAIIKGETKFKDGFNIKAYHGGCAKHNGEWHKEIGQDKPKEKHIVENFDDYEELTQGDITMEAVYESLNDSVASKMLNDIDDLLDTDELEYALRLVIEANDSKDITSIHNTEHIDLEQVMIGAQLNIPEDVDMIRHIVEEYQMLGYYIELIMRANLILSDAFQETKLKMAKS